MNDAQIRSSFHSKKLRRHHATPDTLVVDELGLKHGKCRADIAVINGHLIGYEIKSDDDSLHRLARQVEAYNARDIDAFLSFYADDVVVRRLPEGEIAWDSSEAMRPRYAKRFAENPELNCTITKRVVHGNWVVDHELVTGVKDRPRVRAVLIYEVSGGLIRNVWSLPVEE